MSRAREGDCFKARRSLKEAFIIWEESASVLEGSELLSANETPEEAPDTRPSGVDVSFGEDSYADLSDISAASSSSSSSSSSDVVFLRESPPPSKRRHTGGRCEWSVAHAVSRDSSGDGAENAFPADLSTRRQCEDLWSLAEQTSSSEKFGEASAAATFAVKVKEDAATPQEAHQDSQVVVADDGLDVSFPRHILVECFRCPLCRGLLRDAMTLKECLHSFCRFCLFRLVFLSRDGEVLCPVCFPYTLDASAGPRGGGVKDEGFLDPLKVQLASLCGESSSGAAASDRTLQSVVDKLFPFFTEQERLESEELRQFLESHADKPLPSDLKAMSVEYFLQLTLPEPPPSASDANSTEETKPAAEAAGRTEAKDPDTNSVFSAPPKRRSLERASLEEVLDNILGLNETPCLHDRKQAMAIALLPSTSQGLDLKTRIEETLRGERSEQEMEEVGDLSFLPLELPAIPTPFLRIPSCATVQRVIALLALILEKTLRRTLRAACKGEEVPPPLEELLELTLEGRPLGAAHSLSFLVRALRLECQGRCLLLQYRYNARAQSGIVRHRVRKSFQETKTSENEPFAENDHSSQASSAKGSRRASVGLAVAAEERQGECTDSAA